MEGARFEDLPDVLTPAEAARLLRLGRSKTYQQLREGVIPSIRIGRKVLIPKAALVRLFSERG